MAAPRSVGPAVFSWAHRQPSTHLWSLLECAAHGRSSQYGPAVSPGLPPTHIPHKLFTTQCERNCHTYPWCQNANTNISARAARPHKTTKVVKPKPTVDKQWRHTSKNCAALTRSTLLAPVRKHHHGDSIPSVSPTRDNKHRASQGDNRPTVQCHGHQRNS